MHRLISTTMLDSDSFSTIERRVLAHDSVKGRLVGFSEPREDELVVVVRHVGNVVVLNVWGKMR
jgi:hypothetical protein